MRGGPVACSSFAGSAAAGHDAGPFEREVAIGPPHLRDAEALEEDEAGGIDVRKLVTAQALELAAGRLVMGQVRREELQPRQIGERQPKRPRGFLAEAVQEPPVCLCDDGQRGVPTSGWIGEEPEGCGMMGVAPVEERYENPGVEEDPPGDLVVRGAVGRIPPRRPFGSTCDPPTRTRPPIASRGAGSRGAR